jgi:hypothetical protein
MLLTIILPSIFIYFLIGTFAAGVGSKRNPNFWATWRPILYLLFWPFVFIFDILFLPIYRLGQYLPEKIMELINR